MLVVEKSFSLPPKLVRVRLTEPYRYALYSMVYTHALTFATFYLGTAAVFGGSYFFPGALRGFAYSSLVCNCDDTFIVATTS